MSEFEKTINVREGPWEAKAFPNGEENIEGVVSKTITTVYKQDGYLCESTCERLYRKGGDYFDNTSIRRIIKLDG